jgi:hypothetical protein
MAVGRSLQQRGQRTRHTLLNPLAQPPSSFFLDVVLLKRDVVLREIMTRELRWAVRAARTKEPHCDPCGSDFLQLYSHGCVRSFTVRNLPARTVMEFFVKNLRRMRHSYRFDHQQG